MYYSSAGLIALIIHLIINHDVLRKEESGEIIPAHQTYRMFLISIAAYFVFDILWGVLYDHRLLTLCYADTVLYFLCMSATLVQWIRFVIVYLRENGTFSKVLTLTGMLIMVYQIVVLIINFFQPLVFWFDETGAYNAGPGRYIHLAAQIVMFSITAGYAFMVAVKNTGRMRNRYRIIGWCSASMTFFVIAQSLLPLLPMYAIGSLLGICVLHSFVLENEKEEYRGDLEEQLQESRKKGNIYDPVTGLSVMKHFFELANQWKDDALNAGKQPALLYMDFSGMKFYNKKYGFSEGDRLLQAFAKILIRMFGKEQCGRIGSDHFAAVTMKDGLEERLFQMFGECQNMNEGRSLPVHVGIYSGQEGNIAANVACDRAKLACSELRGQYASCYNYFSQELNDDEEKRRYIVENLDRAITQRRIMVYYQPIVRATNHKICDEEALSRWDDPDKGFLSPADFIPALEEAGLIYRLDLYVLENVLEKLQVLKQAGLAIVPQSINLSRSDFDTCDIVEEIRKRVDDAGIDRDRITIEITESIIGSDFNFIRDQVNRFRELGFPVWIDDFGSGYSSLDVLQSLKFDLIKFDMGFMRKLDEGDNGKIILTELMQMATSLGVDTVCEGVETEEQVRFLQEIGCSRLQGYYFSRPVPFIRPADLREKVAQEKLQKGKDTQAELPHEKAIQAGYENPEEASYYNAIGKVNLYDLTSIVNEEESLLPGFFNTIPMSILEVKDQKARYVRSNQSYRDFMKRFFRTDILDEEMDFRKAPEEYGLRFIRAIQQCCQDGSRAFFDEKLPDGSMSHCFVRRIGSNPVTGMTAAAIAVLSVSEADEGASYADIERTLAADYYMKTKE